MDLRPWLTPAVLSALTSRVEKRVVKNALPVPQNYEISTQPLAVENFRCRCLRRLRVKLSQPKLLQCDQRNVIRIEHHVTVK